MGTFEELFDIFALIFQEMKRDKERKKIEDYIKRRSTKEEIVSELETVGFSLSKSMADTTNIRFVDAEALLDHSLIRIGFRESWENLMEEEAIKHPFFSALMVKLNQIIEADGEFRMSIPMLYLEFEKP